MGTLLALVFGGAGFYFGTRKDASAPAVATLSGTPDRKKGGKVNDFLVEWRTDADGNVSLFREYRRAKSKTKEDGITRFQIGEIASIERRTYAQEYPDAMQSMATNNHKDRAEGRALEVVAVVFRDAQEIEAGWQRNANGAAQVQSALIEYLNGVGTHLSQQQVQAARMAALGADDAPL